MALFSKLCVRAIFLITALIVFMTVGLNVYLGLSGVKKNLVLQAQEALGKPIEVGFVYFLPWSGLHVQSITITDSALPLLLQAKNLSLSLKSILKICKNSEQWDGEVQIKKILLNNQLVLKKTLGVLHKTPDAFSINPLEARFFGGKIQGSFLLQKNENTFSSYKGSTSFSDVPLKEALSGTALQEKVSAGKIQGTLDLDGQVGRPESIHGSGTLELLGAELKTANFFGSLSRLFPVEELQLLKLHEAKAKYTLSSKEVNLSLVRLKSDNALLTAHGTIFWSGGVAINAQLLLSGKLGERFRSLLPSQLGAIAAQVGYCEIPFKIYGSMDHLQTNFLDQVFTQQLQNNVEGILQGFLNKALR